MERWLRRRAELRIWFVGTAKRRLVPQILAARPKGTLAEEIHWRFDRVPGQPDVSVSWCRLSLIWERPQRSCQVWSWMLPKEGPPDDGLHWLVRLLGARGVTVARARSSQYPSCTSVATLSPGARERLLGALGPPRAGSLGYLKARFRLGPEPRESWPDGVD